MTAKKKNPRTRAKRPQVEIVEITPFELAALEAVTEHDPARAVELLSSWEIIEGRAECPEIDARAALLRLGVRFG